MIGLSFGLDLFPRIFSLIVELRIVLSFGFDSLPLTFPLIVVLRLVLSFGLDSFPLFFSLVLRLVPSFGLVFPLIFARDNVHREYMTTSNINHTLLFLMQEKIRNESLVIYDKLLS